MIRHLREAAAKTMYHVDPVNDGSLTVSLCRSLSLPSSVVRVMTSLPRYFPRLLYPLFYGAFARRRIFVRPPLHFSLPTERWLYRCNRGLHDLSLYFLGCFSISNVERDRGVPIFGVSSLLFEFLFVVEVGMSQVNERGSKWVYSFIKMVVFYFSNIVIIIINDEVCQSMWVVWWYVIGSKCHDTICYKSAFLFKMLVIIFINNVCQSSRLLNTRKIIEVCGYYFWKG